MRKRILLVESNTLLRQILSEQLLGQEDFQEVAEAATGAEALEKALAESYDIILTDVELPDMDGREICKRLREGGLHAPIIIVASSDKEQDALTAGANDYVTRPFRLSVLLARIRAHLRQHEQGDGTAILVAQYKFLPSARVLLDKGRKIRLTEKEAAILAYLLRAGNTVVGRETLLHEVWGYGTEIMTHTLETHVYRLRQKLEQGPSPVRILITEPGGYRLQV